MNKLMPKTERGRKTLSILLWAGITMSTGYAFMTLTTPSETQLLASLSPSLRREYERDREAQRKRNDAALQRVFEERNIDRPAWIVEPYGSRVATKQEAAVKKEGE